jgi:predicted enzyme related to lactoylglutathione lyase
MLRGFCTVSYWAADLESAKQWYTELLGVEPYYVVPGYIEFRIGDYQHELGIIDKKYAPPSFGDTPGGTVMYWHVDDVNAALERLYALGAQPFEPPVNRGEGFITASVLDPFGNILGVMYNPHYLSVLTNNPQHESAPHHTQ